MLLMFYIIGGMLASGLILGSGVIGAAIQDVKNAYGSWDKFVTFWFQLGQMLLWFALAFIFSWIAVGFIYMVSKND